MSERDSAANPLRPIVWSIAGADPGAGAGIQADLLTMQDLGCHGCTIISVVTAQNSTRVIASEPVSPAMLAAQFDGLAEDMPPAAIKLGLLGNRQQAQWLACRIAELKKATGCKVIYDPVAIASTGHALAEQDLLAGLDSLLPQLDLLTPNANELAILSQQSVATPAQVVSAAVSLCQRGVGAVLVKGGHLMFAPGWCLDFFTNGTLSFWLAAPRLDTPHGHGTGCTYASAIAALLAQGYVMEDAITLARAYLQEGLASAEGIGAGPGPVAHNGWPQRREHFPQVILPDSPLAKALALCWPNRDQSTPSSAIINVSPFIECPRRLGLYPVVDSVEWIKTLLSWGVRTLQLRIKDPSHPELEQQISAAVALGREYQARLFINDYWQLAIKHGAYGVHLGQEDLELADLDAIQRAGLRLGISTHGYYEIARALSISPSYIALGHIFPTRTKQMPSAPQGLKRLERYAALLKDKSVVAIGGISTERVEPVLRCGVGSVAVVTAITESTDPQATTLALLEQIESPRQGAAHHG